MKKKVSEPLISWHGKGITKESAYFQKIKKRAGGPHFSIQIHYYKWKLYLLPQV